MSGVNGHVLYVDRASQTASYYAQHQWSAYPCNILRPWRDAYNKLGRFSECLTAKIHKHFVHLGTSQKRYRDRKRQNGMITAMILSKNIFLNRGKKC